MPDARRSRRKEGGREGGPRARGWICPLMPASGGNPASSRFCSCGGGSGSGSGSGSGTVVVVVVVVAVVAASSN